MLPEIAWETNGRAGVVHLTISDGRQPTWNEKLDVANAFLRQAAAKRIASRFGCDPDDLEHRFNGIANELGAEKKDVVPAPIVCNLAEIETQKTEWLWNGRVAYSSLNNLVGDPGLGKSMVTADLAARETLGADMPPNYGIVDDPHDVVMLNAEDDVARTIKPRLEAAGADLKRVHIIKAVPMIDGTQRPPSLPTDIDGIRGIVERHKARLLIIDPFDAYLDPNYDAHKNQDVRLVLHRLAMLAEETGIAVLIVRHPNKVSGQKAIYRGSGSIGIVGAARSEMLVGWHPEEKGIRVVASSKCNLGPMPVSLTYKVKPVGDTAVVEWVGECEYTADEIMNTTTKGKKGANAETFLENLFLGGGEIDAVKAATMAENLGIKEKTLQRARTKLGIVAHKSGLSGGWVWVKQPTAEEVTSP